LSSYSLGPKAQSDLAEILDYTVDTWGEKQALEYVAELSACFELISKTPAMGRACDVLSLGLRRIEHRSHVIFYRAVSRDVQISRILHQSRLPRRQYFLSTQHPDQGGR
jgi:toxin ParE1/3/4